HDRGPKRETVLDRAQSRQSPDFSPPGHHSSRSQFAPCDKSEPPAQSVAQVDTHPCPPVAPAPQHLVDGFAELAGLWGPRRSNVRSDRTEKEHLRGCESIHSQFHIQDSEWMLSPTNQRPGILESRIRNLKSDSFTSSEPAASRVMGLLVPPE